MILAATGLSKTCNEWIKYFEAIKLKYGGDFVVKYDTSGDGLGFYSPNVAPVNWDATPTISDTTPTENQVLALTLNGWYGDTPITTTYQWCRDGAAISGATSSGYTVVTADVGHTLSCTITRTNRFGSTTVTTAETSTVVGA